MPTRTIVDGKRIDVLVDSHLRVDANLLGADLVDEILDLLTLENEEKIEKSYRNTPGWWDLPDDFLLADLDGDTLVMPRGFALSLKQLLREYGLRVHWRDHTTFRRGDTPFEMIPGFVPRRHQPEAVRRLRKHRQGIYVAPTGSGKTVSTVMQVVELQPEFSLILVNQIDLVDQWIGEFAKWTTLEDDEIGRIGDGTWTEGQVTVGTIQSIWKNIDELIEEEWFRKWSFVRLDECHHVTAYTFNEIMGRFWARYRDGTSATPSKTGNFMLATTTLGEIVHEDDYDVLKEDGVLLEPHVEVIPTDFETPFWGDHRVDRDKRTGEVEHCNVPGCPKSGRVPHGHRNNYTKVLQKLVRDNARNHLVAEHVELCLGHVQLIVSDQTTHLDEIRKILGSSLYGIPQDRIFMLTGREKKKGERKALVDKIKTMKDCVVLSTVAGEGLDIPGIEIVHMPFPMKNADKVRQIIGRAMRTADGKTGCIILDYTDKRMSVFKAQLRSRVNQCYMKMKLEVRGIVASDQKQRNANRRQRGLGRL